MWFFFLFRGKRGLTDSLSLPLVLSPLPSFLEEVSPFTNPHAGNISISSLSTINHRQTPLLLWHQSVRHSPHRSPSPGKLLSRWMLGALPRLFSSLLSSLSRWEGRRGTECRGIFWAGRNRTEEDALIPSSSTLKSSTPCLGHLPLPEHPALTAQSPSAPHRPLTSHGG